jgi:hypothetical protein
MEFDVGLHENEWKKKDDAAKNFVTWIPSLHQKKIQQIRGKNKDKQF